MITIDFRKISVTDIEGNVNEFDFSKHLGNYMYMNATHISEAELGRKIYHDGEVEIGRDMEAFVIRMAKESGMRYPAWSAIEKMLQ